jgi:hypothetical protein
VIGLLAKRGGGSRAPVAPLAAIFLQGFGPSLGARTVEGRRGRRAGEPRHCWRCPTRGGRSGSGRLGEGGRWGRHVARGRRHHLERGAGVVHRRRDSDTAA